jgi:broad specificity phosphatase PhoE
MRAMICLLLAVMGITSACTAAPSPPSFYVMRHLQKGVGDDPGLSEEGRRGAERLAGWIGNDPPAAIYVSTTRRARETAAPLAERFAIVMKDYDPRDTAGLVARVRQEKGNVLIVGHSNTVPEIVAALGGERPAALLDSDYGGIWHVGANGRTEKIQLGD